MRGPRQPVELGVHLVAELHPTLDELAVRERERKLPGRLVPGGLDAQHRSVALAAVQRALIVAEPEAPVADDAPPSSMTSSG